MPTALHFTASDTPEAQTALEALQARYGDAGEDRAELVVARSAATALCCRHCTPFSAATLPIYGMNLGSVGFSDEREFREEGAPFARLEAAEGCARSSLQDDSLMPLAASNRRWRSTKEVSLLRQTRQTAKLRVVVDSKVRLEELDLRRYPGVYARRQHRHYNLFLASVLSCRSMPCSWR